MTAKPSQEPAPAARERTGPLRVPPLIGVVNERFWTGGRDGELLIQHCGACGWWNHPPSRRCRRCLAVDPKPEPVAGRGVVASFTINHQQWSPRAAPDPYVIALVDLDEQLGLRLLTNIVNCPVRDVAIGQRVRVVFELLDDVAIPLFEPVPATE
ncbi:Zn-ribbon domain-containing OB-fold protein [Pseudonocardia sp. GCM10023141]|uniref:Zn-ribbon domain-containing OB-fold protein n=1 Tax=Pseudonocardia sp. GCM10023141 TaxID=3252653 RepID=UPI0036136721